MRGKAEKMGVKEIFIDDLREEFVKDYVFPMFRYSVCSYSMSSKYVHFEFTLSRVSGWLCYWHSWQTALTNESSSAADTAHLILLIQGLV